MIEAYRELYRLGHAHSVETWIDGELAGGLYGVAIGRVFFGESMFSRVRDASKIALAALVARLKDDGFGLIDCQMHTRHLETLGAREIPRERFSRLLEELIHYPRSPGTWSGASFAQVQCPS
jgi:leucyl/phenylalanyl-tRNA--protein transferase